MMLKKRLRCRECHKVDRIAMESGVEEGTENGQAEVSRGRRRGIYDH